MGWFDEQIKQRKYNDDEMFSESFANIAGSVLGKRFANAQTNHENVREAIEEILTYYHVKFAELPEDLDDINEELEYHMRPYGIMRRNVHLDSGWEKDAVGAMLGTRKDDGSIVALIPGKIAGYSFYDYQNGKKIRINKKTESLIDDEALAFYTPFPIRKINVLDFLIYIKNQLSISDFIMILLSFAASAFLGILSPKLSSLLFGTVVESNSIRLLISMAIFMICLCIYKELMNMVKELILGRIQTKLEVSVQAATMMRILSLPASFFKEYSAGELSSYVEQMNGISTMLLTTVLSQGLTSLFALIYVSQIYSYAPALAAPALGIVLCTVLFSVISAIMEMKRQEKRITLTAKKDGMSYSMISGIQKIKLAGAEKRAFSRWGNLYAKEASYLYNPPLFLKLNGVLTMGISLIGSIIMYYLAIKSGVSVSNYYAFTVSYGLVMGAFNSLAGITLNIAAIKPIFVNCKPIMEAVPEISKGKLVIDSLQGNLELSHVSFRYDESSPLILDDLSLKIKRGQYLAIVGKTGCGKSTLMRLLLGFEKPGKGAIYYDGKDLSKIDLKSLRRKIGTVMQNGKLFQGDIFSNITISAPWLTLEDAWEAAQMAGLAGDIALMPMGMSTLIQEGSGGISGGQRQRIMIARAIAPKPKVLMFDEATSALDNITQKQVSDSLDQLKCTRIVIAHRLSTIEHCDRIIVLDDGKIIEDGTYKELIAKDGFFARLVERQQVN